MTEPLRISGEAFAQARLRDNPQLSFEAIRQEGDQAGIAIQAIQYGRARRKLGLSGTPPAASQSPESLRQVSPQQVSPQQVSPQQVSPQQASPQQVIATTEPVADDAKPAAEVPAAEPLQAVPPTKLSPTGPSPTGRPIPIAPKPTTATTTAKDQAPRERKISQPASRKAAGSAPPATAAPKTKAKATDFGKQLNSVRSVDDLVLIIKNIDDERRRLRELLEKIATTIDEAMG